MSVTRRVALLAALILSLMATASAHAQIMSARRMAMGGVTITRGGPGSDALNVAYRAVPKAPSRGRSWSLPIGLAPLLSNPPVFDPNDPEFNAFELADLLFAPPWNVSLQKPAAPSSDIGITLAKDQLAIDLGDVRTLLPRHESRFGAVSRAPALGVGRGHAFVVLSPLIHYDNELSLNPALQATLIDAQPFVPLTDYALEDQARAQAALQGMLGWAQPLWRRVPGKSPDRTGLYFGARAKLLRGLGYGEVVAHGAFTTPDTLFGSDPVDLAGRAELRTAAPADGGFGRGFDVGTVLVVGRSEIGLAANDLSTLIDWTVRESVVEKDSVTGEFHERVVNDGVAFTSQVPATYQLTASTVVAGVLVAGDVVRGTQDQTTERLGVERWLGPIALRAGVNRDANQLFQTAGGIGLRLGRFGIDVAVATNSRNLSRERAVELGAGIAFFH